MARAPADRPRDGDPLKTYIVVMGLLVVVMAVLYLVIDKRANEYAEGNAWLEAHMTGKNLPASRDMEPNTIPDLALAVEQFAKSAFEASEGSGLERHISQDLMGKVATATGLSQVGTSNERTVKTGDKYETISAPFDFLGPNNELPEQWQVLKLLYFIESRGRYRVSELQWQVADPSDDPEPPFDKVKKTHIVVSLRLPIMKTD